MNFSIYGIVPLNLAGVVVKARVVVPEPAAVYLILSETRHITGEDTYFLSGGYSTLLGLGMAPPPPPQISDSRIPRRHSQGLRGEEGGGEEEGAQGQLCCPLLSSLADRGSSERACEAEWSDRGMRRTDGRTATRPRRRQPREMSDRMVTAMNQNFFEPPQICAFTSTSALTP